MSARNNRILHIDGDSFFASCEIALDPKLEGRPVWVGGGRRGDGIVTVSYTHLFQDDLRTHWLPCLVPLMHMVVYPAFADIAEFMFACSN